MLGSSAVFLKCSQLLCSREKERFWAPRKIWTNLGLSMRQMNPNATCSLNSVWFRTTESIGAPPPQQVVGQATSRTDLHWQRICWMWLHQVVESFSFKIFLCLFLLYFFFSTGKSKLDWWFSKLEKNITEDELRMLLGWENNNFLDLTGNFLVLRWTFFLIVNFEQSKKYRE